MAFEGDAVVGRIAVFDDRLHNDVHKDNAASFGFFEAADEAASRALFATAESWGRSRGRTLMRGPLDPSLNESAGLLIDGFDTDSMLMMPHNPRDTAGSLNRSVTGKQRTCTRRLYNMDRGIDPIIERLAIRMRERHGITVRQLSVAEFGREVEQLRVIYSGAWEKNWGFSRRGRRVQAARRGIEADLIRRRPFSRKSLASRWRARLRFRTSTRRCEGYGRSPVPLGSPPAPRAEMDY